MKSKDIVGKEQQAGVVSQSPIRLRENSLEGDNFGSTEYAKFHAIFHEFNDDSEEPEINILKLLGSI